jgi:lysozyme family protein
MTDDQIIDDILGRELAPREPSWAASRATQRAADRGGWTRGGITAVRWGQYKGWERPATREELDAIAEPEARAFYRKLYVEPFKRYPDPLRLLLIDFGVTSRHVAVFSALQRALRDQGLYLGLIDGIPGIKTQMALADVRCDPRRLYLDTVKYRCDYYVSLAFDAKVHAFLEANPDSQLHNCRGWLARAWQFVNDAPEGPRAQTNGPTTVHAHAQP